MIGEPVTLPSLPRALRPLAINTEFPRGSYLYQPAQRMETIYVIRRGWIKIGSYQAEGAEVVYDTVGPGDFCGNLKYLGGAGNFQEFARTLCPVDAWALNLTGLMEQLAREPKLHHWLSRLLVRRWARAEQRMFRIASLPPADRLVALLEEFGALPDTLAHGLLTQSDMASLTGLSRQTIAKLLRQL